MSIFKKRAAVFSIISGAIVCPHIAFAAISNPNQIADSPVDMALSLLGVSAPQDAAAIELLAIEVKPNIVGIAAVAADNNKAVADVVADIGGLALAEVANVSGGDTPESFEPASLFSAKFATNKAKNRNSNRFNMMSARSGEKNIDTMIYAVGPKGRAQLSAQDQLALGNKRMNIWIQGFANASKMDNYSSNRGYHSKMAGALTGVSYKVKKDIVAGAAAGYSHTKSKVNGGLGHTDVDTGMLTFYASAVKDRFVINGSLTGMLNHFKQDRNITVVNLTAHNTHSGYSFSPSADIGYNISYKRTEIKPFVKLTYSYNRERGYQESGAGVLNLKINSNHNSSFRSEFGARFTKEYKVDSKNIQPFLSLSYVNVDSIKKSGNSYVFISDTGSTAFFSAASGKYRNYAAISLGANIIAKKYSGATTIAYSGKFNQKYSAHQLLLGYAMPF